MLTVFDVYNRLKSSLIEIYNDKTESSAVLHRVFEYLTGLPFTDVTVYPEKEVDTTFETIENVLARIKKSEPLEYIFNRAEFLDLKLYTESSVLIPRPETEELALMVSDYLKQRESGLKIIDIGTGSGCIPIYLALQHPENKFFACDISDKALSTAKKNAQKYSVNNLEIFYADILNYDKNEILNNLEFDVIISNPPYVTDSEKSLMANNVLDYEPYTALFVPDSNPLLFYKKISEFATSHLTSGGKIYFEINERFGNETIQMLEKYGFTNVSVNKDLFGKDRMAVGEWRNLDLIPKS